MTDLKEQTAQNELAKKLDIKDYAELVKLGLDSLKQEKFDFALKVLMQAIQLNANGCEAYHGRGVYYLYQENYEFALADFNKAIQLNPNFAKAYRAIGVYYYKQNNDELGFEWFKKAAELGDIQSQYSIGVFYKNGTKIEKNSELAFEWFKRAAEQGHKEAQYELADCYFYGKGTEEDLVLGFDWCKKAAEQGNIEAQYELADCYLNGIGIEKNAALGLELLIKLTAQENIKAEFTLRNYFLHNKENENLEQYLQCFQEKAEQGDIEAYYLLAEVYFKGIKVKKNRILALEWLEKLLTQEEAREEPCGYRLASIFLDFSYDFESNNSEVISTQKIIELYAKAAEYGSANACIRLADYYRLGNHVEKNDVRAFEYYKKAYEIGSEYPVIRSLAALQLSSYYTEGNIVKKDADLVESYTKQIDEFITDNQNTIKFPYKRDNSAILSLLDGGDGVGKYENTVKGKEAIDYFTFHNRLDEADKIVNERYENDDGYELDTILINDYIPLTKAVVEKNKEFKKLNAELKEKTQQLQAKEKELDGKNKELNNLIAMFAHNFLGTLQCIRSNAEHENNAKIHLKTVKMMSGALTAFSIISADDDKLIEQLKQDNTCETNLLQNLANNLALAISQLLSKTNKDKIINIYLNYLKKTAQIKPETNGEDLRFNENYRKKWQALQHQWEDEFNDLFSENVELSRLQAWLETNFFPVQITGFDNYNIRFKEYGITDSIFLVVFMEILVNALKYMDVSQNQPLILTLDKKDQHYHLICENSSSQETYRGTHKGMDFLKSIAKKLNAQFITESTEQQFKTTFIIPVELLD